MLPKKLFQTKLAKRIHTLFFTTKNERLISMLVLVTLLAVIPLTVYMGQQTQDTRQHACDPKEDASCDPGSLRGDSKGDGTKRGKAATCKSKTGKPLECACASDTECTSKYCFVPNLTPSPSPTIPTDPKLAKQQAKDLAKAAKENAKNPMGKCATAPATASATASTSAKYATQSASADFVLELELSGFNSYSGSNLDALDRNIRAQLYSTTDGKTHGQLVGESAGKLSFDLTTQTYKGIASITSPAQAGNYLLLITVPSYLEKDIPVTIGTTNLLTLPKSTLYAGDINSDGKIDILDWNMLIDKKCYSDQDQIPEDCTSALLPKADLNEDGEVNVIDANIFLKSLKDTTTP